MPLGFHVPEWAALYRALRRLCEETGASHAAVMDHPALICAFRPPHVPQELLHGEAERVWDHAAEPHRVHLQRGKKLVVLSPRHTVHSRPYYLHSFANIYVLVIWFTRKFASPSVRAAVTAALPEIEKLTTSLPPPDGPDVSSAAGKMRG